MHASTYTQFGFSLGELTYINSAYDGDAATPVIQENKHHGVLHWIHGLVHRMAEWQHRRSVMQELAMMSDRELSDIGLLRADVSRIFNREFRTNTRGGDYIGY